MMFNDADDTDDDDNDADDADDGDDNDADDNANDADAWIDLTLSSSGLFDTFLQFRWIALAACP